MLKLYGINVNEDVWDIQKIKDDDFPNSDVYKLYDKVTGDKYTFYNILGINEISDHEFLVCHDTPRKLMRMKVKNSRKKVIFDDRIEDFVVLTDDKILFTYTDKSAKTRGECIYSISKNNMVDEFDWLKRKALTVYKDDNDKSIIYIEDNPSFGNGDYFLSFAVDGDTLEPISDCYSYLRDKFIKINNKEDYLKLVEEENKYIRIVEDIRLKERIDSMKQAKEKILK